MIEELAVEEVHITLDLIPQLQSPAVEFKDL
jgi:hypothetical protein